MYNKELALGDCMNQTPRANRNTLYYMGKPIQASLQYLMQSLVKIFLLYPQ